MELLKDLLTPKCFSILTYIMSILHLFSGVTLSGITGNIRSGEKRKFSCNVDKNAPIPDKAYVETACYSKYDQMYNSPLPFYGFIILSFSVVLVVYVVYSIFVKSRVEEVERSTNPTDQARDNHERSNQETVHRRSRRVCYSYVFHLVVRFALGVLFTVLQYKVFYPFGFESEFICNLEEQSKMNEAMNQTTQALNSTTTNCSYPPGSEKALWSTIVAVLNIIFASIALIEAMYLIGRAWKSRRAGIRFEYDFEFCKVYLLRKSPYTFMETSININITECNLATLDAHKRQVLNDLQLTEIQCGLNVYVSLNDMYVDLIIHSGRAQHEFTKDMTRHEIHHTYMKPPQNSIRIDNIKDLFTPNEDTMGKTPRTILIVGRPGIGKTSMCRKIMFEWATAEHDEFYSGKIVLFLKFRWFNSEKYREMSLKELLRLGTQENDDEFEVIFQQISADPTKAIIILDGLDESRDDSSCFTDEERAPNDYAEKMTVLTLFIKLVLGKLLKGATVVTTTRPTADHIYSRLGFQRKVEILGFTQDKIKEYVEKFCKNNKRSDTNEKLWNYIKASLELLNLCYIPVNCYIVCATLFQDISKMTSDTLPKTLTELYKKALKFFSKEHGNPEQWVDMKDLDKLAFLGVEKGQLIFDESEVNEHMKISGFFNSLPNACPGDDLQYCFIHFTIQEFLAARHIAEAKSAKKIKEFISSKARAGKWYLVIQFLAGLLGDKVKVDDSYKKHVSSVFKHFINKEKQLQLLMVKCLKECNVDDITKKLAGQIMSDNANLENLQITPIDCSAVVYFLKYAVSLKKLSLNGNPLGESGCKELAKLLQERCLEIINLNICLVNDSGLNSLVTAARSTRCHLNHEHFKLSDICLKNNKITNDGVSYLCDALKDEYCNLTTLDISYNNITDKGVSMLCNTLKDEHCNLTTLDISYNNITDKGVSMLFNTLKDEHCNLTTLDVSSTTTCDGVPCLFDALKDEHCNLTKLGLHGYTINDNHVSLLCEALKDEHCNVTILTLDSTNITDGGVAFLHAALKDEHCNLTALKLQSNNWLEMA